MRGLTCFRSARGSAVLLAVALLATPTAHGAPREDDPDRSKRRIRLDAIYTVEMDIGRFIVLRNRGGDEEMAAHFHDRDGRAWSYSRPLWDDVDIEIAVQRLFRNIASDAPRPAGPILIEFLPDERFIAHDGGDWERATLDRMRVLHGMEPLGTSESAVAVKECNPNACASIDPEGSVVLDPNSPDSAAATVCCGGGGGGCDCPSTHCIWRSCAGGTCTSTPRDCDDDNDCTNDSCIEGTGCVFEFTCDESGDNACQNMRCTVNGCDLYVRDCDDDNPCTDDSCDPDDGCQNVWNCGPPADACERARCDSGGCSIEPIDCDDGITCTTDTCDPETGCVNEWNCSEPSDPCMSRFCDGATGACEEEPRDCDDDNLCTTDSCDAIEGCVNEWNCPSPSDPCTQRTCNAATGACEDEPRDCDDDDICTEDWCSTQDGCRNDPKCGDGNPCTDDFCDPDDGSCSHGPKCPGGSDCLDARCEIDAATGEADCTYAVDCPSQHFCCQGQECCPFGTYCCDDASCCNEPCEGCLDNGELTGGDIEVAPELPCLGNTISWTASGVMDTGGMRRVFCNAKQQVAPGGLTYRWTLTLPSEYPEPLPPLSGTGANVTVAALVAGTYTASFTAESERATCPPADLDMGSASASTIGPPIFRLPDDEENDLPGFPIGTNNDFDEGNVDVNGDPIEDRWSTSIVASDGTALILNGLVPISVDPGVGSAQLPDVVIKVSQIAGAGVARLYAVSPNPSPPYADDVTIIPVATDLVPDFFDPSGAYAGWNWYVEGITSEPVLLELSVASGGGTCTDAIQLNLLEYHVMKVEYKTFIGCEYIQAMFPAPLYPFYSGDGRAFGASGTSRTKQKCWASVNPDSAENGLVFGPIQGSDESHAYITLNEGDPGTSWCDLMCRFYPSPGQQPECSGFSPGGYSMSASRISASEIELHIVVSARGGCTAPLTPGIDADIRIGFRQILSPSGTLGPLEFKIDGTADGFPWHELLLDGFLYRLIDPCLLGTSGLELAPPMDKTIFLDWTAFTP